MSNPSNLYAEKIFSEHPLSLWPLDDTVDYLSLINDSKRNFADPLIWSPKDCSIDVDNTVSSPRVDQNIYSVVSDTISFEIEGFRLVNDYINEELQSVSLGFYAYPNSPNIKSIEFGFRYDEPGVPRYTNSAEYSEEISELKQDEWNLLSKSFPLPEKERIAISPKDERVAIISKSIFSGVATLTTESNHTIQVGQTVYVTNVDNTFDGTYIVSAVTSNTFSYDLDFEDLSSTNTGGTVTYSNLLDTDNTLLILEGSPTKIVLSSHGFEDGNRVRLDSDFGLPAGLNRYDYYYIVNAETDTFELEEQIGSGSLTFSYPSFGNIYIDPVKTITPFIKYNLFITEEVTTYISNFMIGQWSEEFFDKSNGITTEQLSGIEIDQDYTAFASESYALQSSNAYYLCKENKLLSKNINMPMVYGSKNVTSILPERSGGPSLIFPGNGFLNEAGRYRTYTVEFWLRISPDTNEPKRIFGPIDSSDGLYVDGQFLVLKIGNGIQAHDIGEWYRPMLLSLVVFVDGAALFINGEKIIEITFDTSNLELPEETSLAGRSKDWLGFYSYEDIDKFEIDCFSIFSYRVPSAVSKRRWVYGQAVDYPESIAAAYSGESFVVDYTTANYSNNYKYPDIASWRQGIVENISTGNKVLSPPEYSLPNIVFDNKTEESWYRSISNIYSNSISLKPDESWEDTNGYLFFEKSNVLTQKTSGMYGVFEAPIGYNDTGQTLFRLENAKNGNNLDISLSSENKNVSSISIYDIGGEEIVLMTVPSHGLSSNDVVSFYGDLPTSETITIPSSLNAKKEYYAYVVNENSFYIVDKKDAVSSDSTGTFLGSEEAESLTMLSHHIKYNLYFNGLSRLIYKTPAITLGHSFVAGIDFSKFANHFGGSLSTLINNRGQLSVYVGGNKSFTNTFTGSIYRVGFSTRNNLEELDYLFNDNGLPFLRYQFDGGTNLGTSWVPDDIADAGYLYEDYIDDILSHIASYTLVTKDFFGERYLDIQTSSTWQDYVPLSYFAKNVIDKEGKKKSTVDFLQINNNTIVPQKFDGEYYDTSYSDIKTYISFQTVSGGPTNTEKSFSFTAGVGKSKLIEPDENWINTKYEIVNGSIVYVPEGVDIEDLALVIHISMKSRGIIKNPIRVKSLEISGRSLDALVPNTIESKLGATAYPYTKYGFYYDYKKKNPYLIYKGSTPHLYLTKNSGIELTGNFSESNRGISFLVNKERANNYKLSALNFSTRFSRNDIVQSDTKIIEIEGKNPDDFIYIWMKPSLPSDSRFSFYATDRNDNPTSDVVFYINGEISSNPTISIEEWNMIGIGLISSIDVSNASGNINFIGPLLINNISFYALDALQRSRVNAFGSSQYFGVGLDRIFNLFAGTNKTIVSDDVLIAPTEYRYSVNNDATIQSATVKVA